MHEFLKRNSIRFAYTTPYHPSVNRRAERMVRELKESLKIQVEGNTECKVLRFLFEAAFHAAFRDWQVSYRASDGKDTEVSTWQATATDKLATHKLPGPDRICVEFYKDYKNIVHPMIFEYVQNAYRVPACAAIFLQAHTVLISISEDVNTPTRHGLPTVYIL